MITSLPLPLLKLNKMRNLTAIDNLGQTWKQVQKRTAKKLFNQGVDIVLCGSNIRPFGNWSPEVQVNSAERNQINSFESVCDSMSYYNCNPWEGRYIHFYVKNK